MAWVKVDGLPAFEGDDLKVGEAFLKRSLFSLFVLPTNGEKGEPVWVDLLSGEVLKVDGQVDLTDQDIIDFWELVEAADLKELQSFVDDKVFKMQYGGCRCGVG